MCGILVITGETFMSWRRINRFRDNFSPKISDTGTRDRCACNKSEYFDERAAQRAIEKMEDSNSLHIYQCTHPGRTYSLVYHVGHIRKGN